MRDLTRFSTVMVMGIAIVSGCTLDGDGEERVGLPDACATAVLPPDAAPDSQPPPPICGVASEGTLVLGQSVTGSTVGRTNTYAASCGYGSSADVAYRFVAPTDGTYVFDVDTADFEAVFELIDSGSCTPLACSYGAGGPAVVPLAAGQEIVLVVDGYGFSQGTYELRADMQPVCSPQVVSGTLPISTTVTLTGTSQWSSACGGSGPEATFRYTIPADGVYVFDTIGSAVDTQLYVRGDCNGSEYACDDNGATGGAATLSNYLYAGSVFEFVVDTNTSGGTVHFNISGPPPPPPPPACPETSIGSTSPQTINGTTAAAASVMSGTCGGYGPEKTYAFTAPAAGMYQFDTNGSPLDTVVYVRSGSCTGAELACNDDTIDLSSLVQVQLAQGQTVVVVVDSYADGAPYTLHVLGPL